MARDRKKKKEMIIIIIIIITVRRWGKVGHNAPATWTFTAKLNDFFFFFFLFFVLFLLVMSFLIISCFCFYYHFTLVSLIGKEVISVVLAVHFLFLFYVVLCRNDFIFFPPIVECHPTNYNTRLGKFL
jgi:hypothetical protein